MRYFSKYQMQAMEQLAVEKGVTMEDLMEHRQRRRAVYPVKI